MYQNLSASTTKRIKYPYAERNKEPILQVLSPYLKPNTRVLELSSGSGQHIAHYATHHPSVHFQPSELPFLELLDSIDAYTLSLPNVARPLTLDILLPSDWENVVNGVVKEKGKFDVVVMANVLHISEWEVTTTLAGRVGSVVQGPEEGGVVMIYGPFKKDGGFTSQGNEEFDASLKQRNPKWGLRDIADVAAEFAKHGWKLKTVHDMPANNFTLIFGGQ
ncbi:hypothetical protein HDV00_000503 [Rhizophlyctis rosea]|nr:hypothetical protein HDV00_000503 [Rhizophlyctis rosea]